MPPSIQQVHVFLAIEFGGLVLISLIGLAILWRLWHRLPRPLGRQHASDDV